MRTLGGQHRDVELLIGGRPTWPADQDEAIAELRAACGLPSSDEPKADQE